jgi:hypothetical protein
MIRRVRRLLGRVYWWVIAREVTALNVDAGATGDTMHIGVHTDRRLWKRYIMVTLPRGEAETLADMLRDMAAADHDWPVSTGG